jgi:hypothetical protein
MGHIVNPLSFRIGFPLLILGKIIGTHILKILGVNI